MVRSLAAVFLLCLCVCVHIPVNVCLLLMYVHVTRPVWVCWKRRSSECHLWVYVFWCGFFAYKPLCRDIYTPEFTFTYWHIHMHINVYYICLYTYLSILIYLFIYLYIDMWLLKWNGGSSNNFLNSNLRSKWSVFWGRLPNSPEVCKKPEHAASGNHQKLLL